MKIRSKLTPKLVVSQTVSVAPLADPSGYTPSLYGKGAYGASLYSQGIGKPVAGSGWVSSPLCPPAHWAASKLPGFAPVPAGIPSFMRMKAA